MFFRFPAHALFILRSQSLRTICAVAIVALIHAGCSSDPTSPAPGNGGGQNNGGTTLDQAGPWTWANPSPYGSVLWRVELASDDVAYAIGSGLSVLKSSDGGANWEIAFSLLDAVVDRHSTTTFRALVAVDEQEVWAVGDAGFVVRTTDGGVSWSDLSIDESRTLRDLHVFDQQRAMVVGDRGAFYSTIDAGTSWNPVAHPVPSADLNVVSFASDDAGWFGGDDTTMYSTTDGGSNWADASFGLGGDILRGEALANGQMLVMTSFGGVAAGSAAGFNGFFSADQIVDVDFVDPDNGSVLYVDGGTQFVGVRTGGVWTHVAIPIDDTALAVARRGSRLAVVGWRGSTLYSRDGGASWNSTFERIGGLDWHTTQFFDVCFNDSGVGIAVGSNGAIVRSADHGQTWTAQSSGSTQDFWSCWITSGGVAFAVSFDGDMVRSQDGGLSWAPTPGLPAEPRRFRDVSMWDDDNGIVVGGSASEYSPILVTHDGGDTWTEPVFDPVAETIALCVYATGTQTAYVGGNPSVVFKTIDGGTTWSKLETGLPHSLPHIMFVDENNGWVSTQRNRVGRTTDGGQTWTESDPSGVNPYALHFADPLRGIGVNATGVVHTTIDGGATWQPTFIGWSGFSHVRSVWMENATDAVIVGTETKIQYTRSFGQMPVE